MRGGSGCCCVPEAPAQGPCSISLRVLAPGAAAGPCCPVCERSRGGEEGGELPVSSARARAASPVAPHPQLPDPSVTPCWGVLIRASRSAAGTSPPAAFLGLPVSGPDAL